MKKKKKTFSKEKQKTIFRCFSSLKHRNLVDFIGVAVKPDNMLCIVTEYMAKGSLLHYLTTRGRSVISQRDLLGFAV